MTKPVQATTEADDVKVTAERIARLERELALIDRMQQDGHFIINGIQVRKDLEQMLERLSTTTRRIGVGKRAP